jgi:hypothetical protein
MKILNVNARYPGARNDYYIWSNSAAKQVMERNYTEHGERSTWIIGKKLFCVFCMTLWHNKVIDTEVQTVFAGDDGYFLEPWLMTPLKHEQPGTPRFLYNDALCSARSVVERLFGNWKSVFRCLSSQRKLMYDPVMAGKIVNACAVLHNMRIEQHIDDDIFVDPAELNALRQAQNNVDHDIGGEHVGRPLTHRALGERIQASFINRVYGAPRRRLN